MRIAIIPARGGSKGVPRKNVRLVAGKPLVAWAIDAARAAKSVDAVYVSTDDAEIAAVSSRFGAKVIMRPPELSCDTASSESALLHAIEELGKSSVCPEEIVFLQCTSPLMEGADIDRCVETMHATGADSAFTAKEFFYFVWEKNADGSCTGINHDKRFRPRRQDRPPQYEENGAIYVMKTAGFLEARHRFFGKTTLSLMPESRSLEIDTEFDLALADRFLKASAGGRLRRPFPVKLDAIVFDFDGVMTDDRVLTTSTGDEAVLCSREDGQGISRAKRWNVPLLILSSEENPVVAARAKKLGIDVIQGAGLSAKLALLEVWASSRGFRLPNIVYVGNDLNDVDCMKAVGFSFAPSSARECAKDAADCILANPGGRGAVRECLEIIAKEIGADL